MTRLSDDTVLRLAKEARLTVSQKHTTRQWSRMTFSEQQREVNIEFAALVQAEREKASSVAAKDVIAERWRQIEAEDWTLCYDDNWDEAELARAAGCYAFSAAKCADPAQKWPWLLRWWKPTHPRRDLVKAGALILAEIERLDRITE